MTATTAQTRELEALYNTLSRLSRTRIGTSPAEAARARAVRRWLSDQLSLWLFCGNAACLRAKCCSTRHVPCHRFHMARVPDDVVAGLRVYLDAGAAGLDPARLRGEAAGTLAALMQWRLRFGLDALPIPAAASPPPPATRPPSRHRPRS